MPIRVKTKEERKVKFTKMQGCGNDYVYVDGAAEYVAPEKKPELVRRLSDRHFGIGGDGVIFVNPSKEADFEMEMYNMDGTRAQMCGNGIRCVAKFVYDKGLTDKTTLSIVSGGKVKQIELSVENGKVSTARVNMGTPILKAADVPVISEKEEAVKDKITVEGTEYEMTCVSMGNPHVVIFMDEIAELDLEKLGPSFENHSRFPQRVNTEFVKVIDDKTVEMRVWERGSGETLACGTGACAVAAACVLNGFTGENVKVRLLGGELQITWNREENVIYMTGPAVTVFEGEVEI